jgi:hypothetical protein
MRPGMNDIRNAYQKTAAVVLVLVFTACAAAQTVERATRSRRTAGSTGTSGAQPTRKVFVRSSSLLVRGAVVEDKLLKNSQFKQMGFVITRDPQDADLVLELRHDLLTMYVFTVVEVKTMNVIAGGKLSSLGGTVADKVAKRFVKEMSAVKPA